jgi:NAD(P)-dependent dehydrogenase (short-subunit alcohol dehydrogenase family)
VPVVFSKRVAVVVGGGGGIGSCVALEFARLGATVVVVDPGVGVEGELLGESTAADAANLINERGGLAVASMTNVTDRIALGKLFNRVVNDHGALDFVVNASGILRFASLVDTTDDDWNAVLDVHINGYLNVLACAIPIMAKAGYGRVVGLTSGSGLARTSPGNIAYGTAKRAVAATTWEIGHTLPKGVRVNVLSPIAATRMVRSAIAASSEGRRAKYPKGVDLSAMPQPEEMAKAVTYLVGDETDWSQGRVIFSTGSEVSIIAPPRLIEVVRSEHVDNFAAALSTLTPEVFGPAEKVQRTGGGSNSRFGAIFSSETGSAPVASARASCLIVSSDAAITAGLESALGAWGMSPVRVDGPRFLAYDPTAPWGFDATMASLVSTAQQSGAIDAIVIVSGVSSPLPKTDGTSWQQLVDSHSSVVSDVMFHGAWLRAAARYNMESGRSIRVVHINVALTPAGRTTSSALSQMVRNANDIPFQTPFDAFVLSLETSAPEDVGPVCSLAARLVCAEDALTLRGAELVADRGWIGIRSHPGPEVTVSFGGPEFPSWVNHAFRQAVAK